MRKSGLVVIFVILVLALGACTRSASQAPQLPQATPEAGVPAVGGGDAQPTDQMSVLQTYATQTAQAESGEPIATEESTVAPAETTPGVDNPTSTPVDSTTPQVPTVTPVALPTTAPVSPSGSVPATYTLQQGEFPYCIARRFNVNPDELLSINSLPNGNFYQPGLVLKMPQTGNVFPANRALIGHPTTYTVGLNDTIYGIACKFGDVSPEQIASANGFAAPYNLQVGQVINIP